MLVASGARWGGCLTTGIQSSEYGAVAVAKSTIVEAIKSMYYFKGHLV